VDVELKFIGESLVVKELGGILVHNLNKIKVKCLPEKLIHEIEVDLSSLKNFDDIIRVEDLNTPEDIEILEEKENLVVRTEKPKTEEQLKEELGEEEKPKTEEQLKEELGEEEKPAEEIKDEKEK